jgi:WD40 repeat protein
MTNHSNPDGNPSPQLQALDFRKDIERLTEGFVGRKWIFDEVDKWLRSSTETFFILTGEAGVGKSAIAARLTQLRKDLIAYHFCIAGRNSTIVPGTTLRSLAAQLGKRLDGYGEALAKTIRPTYLSVNVKIQVDVLDGGQITGVVLKNLTLADPREELESLLTAPLAAMAAPAEPVIILLDSLDEAFTYNPNENLATLLAGLHNLPGWVRIILTTRPEERVLSFFHSIPRHVVAAESQMNRNDIQRYVKNRVAARSLRARLQAASKPVGREEFIARVTELADGNFLYTKILLNDIENGTQSLDNLAALPAGLDEIYTRFLLRIADEWERKYQPLLAVLSVAREPLTFDQLVLFGNKSAQLTGHRMNETMLLQALRVLRQFLDVSGTPGEERYRLFHQSLRDFLGDRKRSLDRACPPHDAHMAVADYYLENIPADWHNCDSYGLRHLPVHLKEGGYIQFLDKLLTDFNWLDAKLQRFDVGALLADYELTENRAADSFHQALRQESHVLHAYPGSLYVQVRNRLWRGDNSELDRVLESGAGRPALPWLRAVSPLPIETSLVRTLSGHTETTNAALLVDQDRRIVSGSWDGTIRVWDVATGQQLQHWDAGSEVDSLVAAPDGSIVVSRDQADKIQVWDGKTGSLAYRLPEKARTLGITADGHGLLLAEEKRIMLWDLKARQRVRSWKSPGSSVASMLSTPDGHSFIAAGSDGAIFVWQNDWKGAASSPGELTETELPSLRTLRSPLKPGQTDGYNWDTALGISEDGRLLAAADGHGFVWLYDLEEHSVLLDRRDDERGYQTVAVSNLGMWLLTGSRHSTIYLWSLSDPGVAAEMLGHTGHVRQVMMTRDGRQAVSAGGEGNVCLWKLSRDRFMARSASHEGDVKAVACSAEGAFAISGGEDGRLCLWDLSSHTLVWSIPNAHGDSITAVALVDADHVISGGSDAFVNVWNIHSRKRITRKRIRGDVDLDAFAFFCDSNRLLAAAMDLYQVRVWDLKKNKLIKSIEKFTVEEKGYISAGAFTPDGEALFLVSSSSGEGEVEMIPLSARGKRRILPFGNLSDDIEVVLLSPDGKLAVLGDIDGLISVYEPDNPKSHRSLSEHRNYVDALALSPDGRWLVSGGWDRVLRIWDLSTGEVVSRYAWQLPLQCADLATTPDGATRIVVGDSQGNVLFFEI